MTTEARGDGEGQPSKMVKFSLLTAFVAALPSIFASPVPLEKRLEGEGIHLFNCYPISGGTITWISVVGYCANDPDCSNPQHVLSGDNVCIMKHSAGWDDFHIWEGGVQSCRFPNGVVFSWDITSTAQSQQDYTYVGWGDNGHRQFAGFKDNKRQGATFDYHRCEKIYYFI
ncbi:hypothetical protein VTJ49DRAFT_6586 [Mycothermus thermophilus]|uniref:Uncharacterized protein n=1 Tax=Humicola insolens TaxID=85995 RepID=A0ABR3V1N0_HUMIN